MFDLDSLFDWLNEILAQTTKKPVDYSIFWLAIDRSIELKIIKSSLDPKGWIRVEFLAEPDEISFALRNDNIFMDFGHLRAFYDN